ncbi:MAG: NAD(P)H-quinone oxidoreductase subunit 3 [Helicobacteraceae bacterium]|jgi:NADH-quinone oxidoreductase subunit A|nr:NAD(P)H-quinone oxidoreductase subunit 3 [Helicobacteraceae bacterium]
MESYFGVFILFVLTFGAFAGTVLLSAWLFNARSARNDLKLKLSIYECGPETSLQPNRISLQFYLFALLFILFDVEIIFMFPWAAAYKSLVKSGAGALALGGMSVFLAILAIGFIYEWKKGALNWRSIK